MSKHDFKTNLTVETILEKHGHRVANPIEADRQIVAILQEQDGIHDTNDWSRMKETDQVLEHVLEHSDGYINVGTGEKQKNFTLNFAFEYVGGFGRFQAIALVLFALIRNMGMFQVYGFAMTTEPQPYLCKKDGLENWELCTHEYICEQREINDRFEFKPDENDSQYIRNWFVTLDLMCMPQEQYNQIGSMYFLGNGLGFIFCFMPQVYGRKSTMNTVLVGYLISMFLGIFNPKIMIKKIAFFMLGFLHIKVTLSYNHMFELIEAKHQVFSSTIISALDVLTMCITCSYYKYVSSDMDHFFAIIFVMSLITTVLYMILVPESPQWLFMNQGSNSQEAIAILNYIAKFNGSKNRIPSDAIFDRLGQYIEDQSVNCTRMSFSVHHANTSYINRSICNKSKLDKKDNTLKEMIRALHKIYFNPKYAKTHIILSIMCICFTNIYFLTLYAAHHLQGDQFTIGILFGLAEFSGVIIGEKIMALIPETAGFKISITIVLICSMMDKVFDLSQNMIYSLFLVKIFFLGIAYNICYCLHQSRTKQSVQIVSFEMFISKGQALCFLCPIIAQFNEPIPSVITYFMASVAVIAIQFLDDEKPHNSMYHPNNADSLQASILQLVVEDTTLQTNRSDVSTHGGLAAVVNRWNQYSAVGKNEEDLEQYSSQE